MLVFEERGKAEYPERNLLEQEREETTNINLNPHMVLTPGFEHRPHWWEASALITPPSLTPQGEKGLIVQESHNWLAFSLNSSN